MFAPWRNAKKIAVIMFATLGIGTSATVITLLAREAASPPSTPAPTITSGPSGTVASADATFEFTDVLASVVFSCSLDDRAFSTCTSPYRVRGLDQGPHLLRLRAKAPGREISATVERAWVIDTQGPTLTIRFPFDGATFGAAAWDAGCVPLGVCGAAQDRAGVGTVAVAVRNLVTGLYWDGSAFASSTELYRTANGTTSWNLPMARPPDGRFRVSVRATDRAGNPSKPGTPSLTFAIDTTPPPVPVFTKTPSNPTTKTNGQFNWTNTEAEVRYECSFDDGGFGPCRPAGLELRDLTIGAHCFAVVAIDPAGNRSAAARFCWTVETATGAGLPFTISGGPATPLYPGTSQPIDLSITNPNSAAIRITSVSAAINDTTSKSGCRGTVNFVFTPMAGAAQPVIPANSTRTLSQLGIAVVQRPRLQMLNLNVNQDACKGAAVTLTYSGTAVSV